MSLAVRDRQPEIMDQPGLDPAEHRRALRGLDVVNGISRTSGRIWSTIERELPETNDASLRILDVACGSGRTATDLWLRGRQSGWNVEVTGCDVSEVALEHARTEAAKRGANVDFIVHDVVANGIPEGYDVVCCSLFLHHLADDEALAFLSSLRGRARRLVIVGDLVRSRWGYVLAWCGCHLLSRSRVVHNDGPLSVKAAFSPAELCELVEQAGLSGARTTRTWPERFLLVWKRNDDE